MLDFLKFFFSVFFVVIEVRVVFLCKCLICFLNILFVGVVRNVKYFVIVYVYGDDCRFVGVLLVSVLLYWMMIGLKLKVGGLIFRFYDL